MSDFKITPVAVKPGEELYYIKDTGCDVNSRIIYLCEELEVDSYNNFLQAFKYLESLDKNAPIILVIDTPGGDTTYMFSVYDVITSSETTVIGIGTGEIASAGVLILACCDKRYVTENAVAMNHQTSHRSHGRYDEVKARRKWEDWIHKQWAKLLARHTDQDHKYWERVVNKEAEMWILGGDEIVEASLADGVIKNWSTDIIVDTALEDNESVGC